MKKVSAAFDGLKFSEGTLQHAIELAKQSNSLLSGVFLDDFTYHSYKLFDLVGSQGVSKEKMKHLLSADKETRQKATDLYENECKRAQINYVIHHDKNIAIHELIKESIYSDIVLIGADETLSHFNEERPTGFVKDFLTHVECPVMIIPRSYHKIEKVLLLYDGSVASVFAIKMFNYMMPWMQNLDTEVVTVLDPDKEKHIPQANLIKEFVDCHYPKAIYTVLKGDEKKEILAYLKKSTKNTLVVLGAYQRGVISMYFKESMADLLMKELDIPLFIAHK